MYHVAKRRSYETINWISVAFTLFIYLYGLQASSSIKYTPGLYLFPVILLIISIACFGRIVYQYDQSLKKNMKELKTEKRNA